MAALQYPQVNGAKVSFCSLEFQVGGFQFTGIKSINYKEPLESAVLYGNQVTVQGETRGRVRPAGDIEIYRDTYEAFIDYLSSGGSVGFSEPRFTFTVGYAELGATLTTSDILPNVRFHSPDFSGSEGIEALTVKMQMNMIGQILWHGRTGPKRQLSENPIVTR
jgi:hypothetical protein